MHKRVVIKYSNFRHSIGHHNTARRLTVLEVIEDGPRKVAVQH